MIRRCLAAVFICLLAANAIAATKTADDSPNGVVTPDQIFVEAMRQAIGAPARADLGDQATLRLDGGLLLVPHDPAVQVLRVNKKPVPADFLALLITDKGMDEPGYVLFVPAGFIDANAALEWTQDDVLDSLSDTVEHDNAEREKKGLQAREVRRWIRPPIFDADNHTLSWAALIVPKSAPRESDGQVTVYGLVFGRQGYIQLSILSSVENAEHTTQTVDTFLHGVRFLAGKTYAEYQPGEKRAPAGLAGAMGIDTLHKARARGSFWASDTLIPTVGAVVAAVGALSLFIYVHRHMRRRARRV